MNELKENQERMQKLIKEELTKLWNGFEEPTFKIILEKLNKLVAHIQKGKQIIEEEGTTSQEKAIGIIKPIQPEIVPINVWGRTKEPVMVYISKMKPKLSESVNKALDILEILHKEGRF